MLPWNMDCLLGFFVMGYILFPSLSVALLPGGGAMVHEVAFWEGDYYAK
jgi:hypothetical protein